MSKSSPLISIVVPVYNTGKYLAQCVGSVIAQTYTNIEILLIDDGSTDNSGSICDRLAEKDDRIKVWHIPNSGSGHARNTGIRYARGEFVLFLDSDDFWAEKEGLQKVIRYYYSLPTPVDFIVLKFKYFYEKDRLFKTLPDYTFEENSPKTEKLNQLVASGHFPVSPCIKFTKRRFLTDQSLFFPEGVTTEDIPWSLESFLRCSDFAVLNDDFYTYRRQVSSSVTHSVSEKKFNDLLTIVENHIEEVKETIADSSLQSVLFSFWAYQYSILMGMYALFSSSSKKSYFRRLKKYRWILQYDLHPKVKKVNRLLAFVPFFWTSKLLGFYIKHCVNK